MRTSFKLDIRVSTLNNMNAKSLETSLRILGHGWKTSNSNVSKDGPSPANHICILEGPLTKGMLMSLVNKIKHNSPNGGCRLVEHATQIAFTSIELTQGS
jgi:hypothetical protein